MRLDRPPYDAGLRRDLKQGFVYFGLPCHDARLVLANASDASKRGARILVGVECTRARREQGVWRAELSNGETVQARAVVNAAGPWVKQVLNDKLGQATRDAVRLVKGSHIVLPRLYKGEHAFILQNDDRRVVFMIPFEEHFTLIGTTDIDYEGDAATPFASEEEVAYLCRAAGRYLARPPRPAEVVWTYAGVRPLYDDGSEDPSAITRDYTLRVDDNEGAAPSLSVFGGKIRPMQAGEMAWRSWRLLPRLRPLDRARAFNREAFQRSGRARPSSSSAIALPRRSCRRVFRRHGTLGTKFSRRQPWRGLRAGLTAREGATSLSTNGPHRRCVLCAERNAACTCRAGSAPPAWPRWRP